MLLNENVKEGLSFHTQRITESQIKTLVPSGLTLVSGRTGCYIIPLVGSLVVDSSLLEEPYSGSGQFYLLQSNDYSIIQSVLTDLPFVFKGIFHNFKGYYEGNGLENIQEPGLELRLLCDNYGLAGRGDIQISFAYYYQKAIE